MNFIIISILVYACSVIFAFLFFGFRKVFICSVLSDGVTTDINADTQKAPQITTGKAPHTRKTR
jgi:hypothetical protein